MLGNVRVTAEEFRRQAWRWFCFKRYPSVEFWVGGVHLLEVEDIDFARPPRRRGRGGT